MQTTTTQMQVHARIGHTLLGARPSSRHFSAIPFTSPRMRGYSTIKASAVEGEKQGTNLSLDDRLIYTAAVLTPLLFGADPAMAIGREYGIVEGRIFSLMHPVVMGSLFAASLYAAYLGFKWREVRTIPDTIKELKTQLPAADEEGNRPPSEAESKIKELEATRKDLIKKKLNEQHTLMGNALLGAGVTFSVAGGLNTFLRTGKLFPGPHLYAGAAITVLWALAAAMTPLMQKGNETARNVHISLNILNICLFAWQVPTGLDIVWKVLQFTQLP